MTHNHSCPKIVNLLEGIIIGISESSEWYLPATLHLARLLNSCRFLTTLSSWAKNNIFNTITRTTFYTRSNHTTNFIINGLGCILPRSQSRENNYGGMYESWLMTYYNSPVNFKMYKLIFRIVKIIVNATCLKSLQNYNTRLLIVINNYWKSDLLKTYCSVDWLVLNSTFTLWGERSSRQFT